MNILVIGSGGREHALIWALKRSKNTDTIFACPGNAGINQIATPALISITNANDVIDFCKSNNIELVVIGPEAPLVDGLTDKLEKANISVFGPSKKAAQLEGSKEFTKKICDKYNIPTASYESFTDASKAKKYLSQHNTYPIVVKADGLAAGKGVVIAKNETEALDALNSMMVNKQFGNAGSIVVIEEFLQGEEISFFALSDGNTVLPFGSAQDHKAVGEGDKGPNTGGMGTYSPAPLMTPALHDEALNTIITPLINGMKNEGIPYKGVIFAGLMVTNTGPKLLEINVRFGDPETQCLMARLKSDLLELLLAACNNTLASQKVEMHNKSALCVVMATKGYPGDYKKGSVINHIERAEQKENVIVFHAGTKRDNHGHYVANGGRVLGVTGLGKNTEEAKNNAYTGVDLIEWKDGFCRRDIGWRAIQHEQNG